MEDIIALAGSSLESLEREFGVIAHNLANINTAGFKRRYNSFSQILVKQGVDWEAIEENNLESPSINIDFTQGSPMRTGRTLDFALAGKGFFVVETPEGPLYTRNGIFVLNQNGQIVDSSGRIVSGKSGPITIPSNVSPLQISVSSDGSIFAGGIEVGAFKLVDFKDNENQLVGVGANCYQKPAEIEPEPAVNVSVRQGFQEDSNVQMIGEMVDMMMVSKLYESNLKYIEARKAMSKTIISVASS